MTVHAAVGKMRRGKGLRGKRELRRKRVLHEQARARGRMTPERVESITAILRRA